MNKTIFFIGLMLFAMFFGAGNLIFPPILGAQAGSNFIPAILGFIATGVFIPFAALLAVALSGKDLLGMGAQVGRRFGLLYAVVVFMTIGALYGIPRTASVAYELGFSPIFGTTGTLPLVLFSAVYFVIAYILSVNPQKVVDVIGRTLTPALLTFLAVLAVRAMMVLKSGGAAPTTEYAQNPFFGGFLQGYMTMDALGGLALSGVVLNAFRDQGIQGRRPIFRAMIGAGLTAAIGLVLVYGALSWIGNALPNGQGFENGAKLLVQAANTLFGSWGNVIFGLIVILACLTTTIGLLMACSEFFDEIIVPMPYKTLMLLFAVFGFLVSILGLNTILSIAVPILVLVYPIGIMLIVLTLVTQGLKQHSALMFRLAIGVTSLYALYDTLKYLKVPLDALKPLLAWSPLFEGGLGWLMPGLLAAAIGYALDKQKTPLPPTDEPPLHPAH